MVKTLFIVSACCFTISILSFGYWLLLRRQRKKVDRSFWVICDNCEAKWRPTAYGPITPDDRYCPICHLATGRGGFDPCNKILEYKEHT